jgi:glycosyltransferase involved in cell wall biosynthesis
MKNVLFVHSSSELYGSDRSLLNIVKNIDKNEFNVSVILPCQGPLVEEMKKIAFVKVEIYEVAVLRRKNLSLKGGITYIKDLIKSTTFLKRFIKENKINIVDTNTAVVFPGAIAAKRCGIKSVWHIREIIKNKAENKVISAMMNRYADIIVANSISTGEALAVNKKKVRVVYNAVESECFISKKEHHSLVVGMAGRINRWKGQKLFVDMAEIVHKHYPSVVFKIAGDSYIGEEYLKEELQKYIEEKEMENNIILLGQVNNMKEFYEELDVFVLPSIQPEPFGLVVIEAMEYEIPVVATKHGGPIEIISEGKDGYLVDFTTANQMAEKVELLLSDEELRKKMGRYGKKKQREKFSISAMVSEIEKVFREVVNS